MRTTRWVTAAALFIGVLALVNAQQGRGQFGGGGFGGPTTLILNTAVQTELKMTDDQVAKAKEWSKEQGAKNQAAMKEKLSGLDFKTDEGRAEMAKINAEMTKSTYADLEKAAILKPEQVKRLRQIDRQNQGVRAFSSADVVETLKLTDSQKSTIKGINEEYQKDSQAIRTEFGIGFGGNKGNKGAKPDPAKSDEGNKKLDKLRDATIAKISESLTADQKTAWKEMVGEPFDTSKLRGGFNVPKKDPEE